MEIFTTIIEPWSDSMRKIEVDSIRPLTTAEVSMLSNVIQDGSHHLWSAYPPSLKSVQDECAKAKPTLAEAIIALRDYYQKLREDGTIVKTTIEPFGPLITTRATLETIGKLTDTEQRKIAVAIRVAALQCQSEPPEPPHVRQLLNDRLLANRIITVTYRYWLHNRITTVSYFH